MTAAVVRDISHHNTIGDYGQFRADNDAFQIKVTEATEFVDSAAVRHYNGCAGKPRAPYHFARPVSIPMQIRHFLARKRAVGIWERPDMLDCEFEGVNSAFIRNLVAEYRHQSGIAVVQVYVGLHDVLTTCAPSGWWDAQIPWQIARYRKIGPPTRSNWRTHLGYDHPGLATYQWDNAFPFYFGSPTRGDVSMDRVAVTFGGQDEMPTAKELWEEPIQDPHSNATGWAKDVLWETNLAAGRLAASLAEQRVLLAQVIANQSDDLSSDDVLVQLDGTFQRFLAESLLPAVTAAVTTAAGEVEGISAEQIEQVASRTVDMIQGRLVS